METLENRICHLRLAWETCCIESASWVRVLKRRILVALIKGPEIPDLSGEKTFLNERYISGWAGCWLRMVVRLQ
jgi:hypothetical protein